MKYEQLEPDTNHKNSCQLARSKKKRLNLVTLKAKSAGDYIGRKTKRTRWKAAKAPVWLIVEGIKAYPSLQRRPATQTDAWIPCPAIIELVRGKRSKIFSK